MEVTKAPYIQSDILLQDSKSVEMWPPKPFEDIFLCLLNCSQLLLVECLCVWSSMCVNVCKRFWYFYLRKHNCTIHVLVYWFVSRLVGLSLKQSQSHFSIFSAPVYPSLTNAAVYTYFFILTLTFSIKVIPFTCLRNPQWGNHLACSVHGSSSASQLHNPPLQKKHFTLSR